MSLQGLRTYASIVLLLPEDNPMNLGPSKQTNFGSQFADWLTQTTFIILGWKHSMTFQGNVCSRHSNIACGRFQCVRYFKELSSDKTNWLFLTTAQMTDPLECFLSPAQAELFTDPIIHLFWTCNVFQRYVELCITIVWLDVGLQVQCFFTVNHNFVVSKLHSSCNQATVCEI